MEENKKSLCLLVTYRCNAACYHCCVEADPYRSEQMSIDEIHRYIDEAASEPSIKIVVFSGGEPTLLGDQLVDAISYANSKKLKTRVVSNGYWGKSMESALAMIDRLMEAGLTEINFSLSDYHQSFIPTGCVQNALRAANTRGLKVALGLIYDRRSKINPETLPVVMGLDPDDVGTIDELYRGASYNTKKAWVISAPVMPVTRAARTIPESVLLAQENFTEMNEKGPKCPSILNNLSVRPNGDVQVCCGCGTSSSIEFVVGNLWEESLSYIINRGENDLIFNWIALKGPYALAHFIYDHKPEILFRKRYVNLCDICVELMSRTDTVEALAKYATEVADQIALTKIVVQCATNRPDKVKKGD